MMTAHPTQLLILPFDHRGTFAKLFGHADFTPEERRAISAYKRAIYDALLAAIERGVVRREEAGILIDEEYGSEIIADAQGRGIPIALTMEKSGQEEFRFEYDNYTTHLERLRPTYAKVLVRYNPEGDAALNQRQVARLKELHDYLAGQPTQFLFELLVPPTPEQAQNPDYDTAVRPALTRRAIAELDGAGIKPDVWKLEGVETRGDVEAHVAAVTANNPEARIIILGRGADDDHVAHWLEVARGVKGVIGFAIGRTIFWDAITKLHTNQFSHEEAVQAIAEKYTHFVKVWKGEL